MGRLVVKGNSVYEIDEEAMQKHWKKMNTEQVKKRQTSYDSGMQKNFGTKKKGG